MIELVDQFLDYSAQIKHRSPHTITSYGTDLRLFTNYCLSDYELEDIRKVTHLVIRSWIMTLKANDQSNVTINRKISALKSFYKYLLRKEIVIVNPMAKVQTLKKSKRLPSFVPEKKMSYLVEESLGELSFEETRDSLVVDLLYMTGMRRSELINLTFSDIDEARSEIKVLGKGNKERRCPVTSIVLKKIARYRASLLENFPDIDHTRVIVTDSGKPAYPKLIYNIVSRKLKSVNGAEKTSPHVLRHTFATHLSSNGAELNAVKELLGHASLAATQVYTHNSIDRLLKEYRRAHPLGE